MKIASRRYIDSSSFKMALLLTMLLALSAGILGYFLVDFGKRDFLRETEAAIDSETNMLSSLKNAQKDGLLPYIAQRAKDDPIVRFRYEDKNGRLLGGTIAPMPPTVQRIAEGVLGFDVDDINGKHVFAAKIHTFDDGSRIVVARNIRDLVANHDRLKNLSWLIIGLMLAVVVVSFAISYFVVSRINRIAAIAENIVETGDLSKRLFIDSRWDDLSKLSQVLNGFLDKIEDLMNGIREVSNNIAHDLRTPLGGLRSDIEALKSHAIDEQKVDALLADADRILAIFQALLRITNIEKAKRFQPLGDVKVGTIIKDVVDLYEPVAEENNIGFEIKVAANLMVRGDGDLLFQLFANILDNAVKFSPHAGVIRVYAENEKDQVMIAIEDQGPGIPEQEKEKVFKHFYRGDSSRSTPGNGLGLSLVKAVIDQHQAKISLEDARPSLRVRIAFQSRQS